MPGTPNPARILVVDDDPMSRELLHLLLEAEGHAVECVASGDLALAHLATSAAPFDLILTDIQMPGISGAALATALRSTCGPATLLLAMSGSGPAEQATARFDGFLLKPFPMSAVAAALKAHRTTQPPAAKRASNARMNLGHSHPAPPPVPSCAPQEEQPNILNETIYGQLAAQMPAAQLHQMYGICLADARERIVAMRRCAVLQDGTQFVRHAHSIKGGCGMIGAAELYALAARLEAGGLHTPHLDGAADVNPLDELSAACDRLERILGARGKAPIAE
jgi:CheY-like chemotaxis protein